MVLAATQTGFAKIGTLLCFFMMFCFTQEGYALRPFLLIYVYVYAFSYAYYDMYVCIFTCMYVHARTYGFEYRRFVAPSGFGRTTAMSAISPETVLGARVAVTLIFLNFHWRSPDKEPSRSNLRAFAILARTKDRPSSSSLKTRVFEFFMRVRGAVIQISRRGFQARSCRSFLFIMAFLLS